MCLSLCILNGMTYMCLYYVKGVYTMFLNFKVYDIRVIRVSEYYVLL